MGILTSWELIKGNDGCLLFCHIFDKLHFEISREDSPPPQSHILVKRAVYIQVSLHSRA